MCLTATANSPAATTTSTGTATATTPTSTSIKRILLCSENVPPQVNGIARRIGHYADGLQHQGCEVTLLHPECLQAWPHVNPWNFTARMMIIKPQHYFYLLKQENLDVVHVVMPLNLSGMWLLAGYKLKRLLKKQNKPALVVSWHCNLVDYIECHSPVCIKKVTRCFTFGVLGVLPYLSDVIVTPTRATDPKVTQLWKKQQEEDRTGVCYTGISTNAFHPSKANSSWGYTWLQRKGDFLQQTNKKHLLVCVSRLSVEKGIEELLHVLKDLPECALWLVGDGPARDKLETLAKDLQLPVQFWGYQKGDALCTAYAAGDLFVCPSLTVTFGQTVNEALAMEVRVALPSVDVFVEAYSDYVPQDAFWKPHDRTDMHRAICKQLQRHANNDPIGVPDVNKLKTWDQASKDLLQEYNKAQQYAASQQDDHELNYYKILPFLPLWWIFTVGLAITIYVYSLIRILVGGSVRHFWYTLPRRIKEARQNYNNNKTTATNTHHQDETTFKAKAEFYLRKRNHSSTSTIETDKMSDDSEDEDWDNILEEKKQD